MPPTRRVLVLAPMTMELKPIAKLLGARPSETGDDRSYVGRCGSLDVVVSQIGVGPSVAAASTQRLLDQFDVERVILSGIAGGIHPSSAIGTVIVPDVVVEVSSGKELRPSRLGDTAMRGTVGTVDELIVDSSRIAGLVDQGIDALEMEASGVGSVCDERSVPWSVVRVISDRPDDEFADGAVLDTLRPDGTADPWAALRLMVTKPGRIPGLVRLGRNSSAAATKAARTTFGALQGLA
jgi:adenosylhomocysteine nucleosidase